MLGIHNFLKLFLIWDSFRLYLVAFKKCLSKPYETLQSTPQITFGMKVSYFFILNIIMFQMVTIFNHQLCFGNASSCNILFVDKPKVKVVIGGHSQIDT